MEAMLGIVGRKAMIFKIAAGVFLGIIAVLIVLKIPTWLAQNREDNAASVIFALSPDQVITRCGQPVSDRTEKFPTTHPSEFAIVRDMAYKYDLGTVVLTFNNTEESKKQGRWILNSVKDSLGFVKYNTYTSQLRALPCLDGKMKH